jgi:hypothetical protein
MSVTRSVDPSSSRGGTTLVRYCGVAVAAALFTIVVLAPQFCRAQDRDVLCSDGSGGFQAESPVGVSVRVGAARNGALALRACEATLGWEKNTLTVASAVPQLDLDAFGVDLGLGFPVAAFQVKKSENDWCPEYRVYSLTKPPRLLRTISGGEFFNAADTDLDGRVEIWTNDAGAIRDFENLTIGDLDAPPAIVLRFERGRLLDVSSEFQSHFDQEISQVRKELDSEALHNFMNSDGKLSSNTQLSAEQMHQLRGAKAKVLEIVWCYLYSGREQQAWHSLAEMWPTEDVDRIRAAIVSARARGIGAQVDGASSGPPGRRNKRAQIFDAIRESGGKQTGVTPPEPILLRYPPLNTPDQHSLPSEALVDLVIDSAGKVRSAEATGKATPADTLLVAAASGWRFIPAFRNGRAVASRTRLAVSLKQ